MKTWIVYEIKNSNGIVEYVGETTQPLQVRFKQHYVSAPNSGNGFGKFYKRNDLTIESVAEFNSKEQALILEEKLQIKYNLVTDKFKRGISSRSRRKLEIEEVAKIRELYATGEWSQIELASKYLISVTAMNWILNNKTYKI